MIDRLEDGLNTANPGRSKGSDAGEAVTLNSSLVNHHADEMTERDVNDTRLSTSPAADEQLPLPSFDSIPQPATQSSSEEPGSPPVAQPTHGLDVYPSQNTVGRMIKYHRHQLAFQKALLDTEVADRDYRKFQLLFVTRRDKLTGAHDAIVTIRSSDGFERAADLVRRSPDFQPDRRLLRHLRITIRYREKAQRRFSRLHPEDRRTRRIAGHLAFIDILKKVYQTLNNGRAYSPRRH